MNLQQLRMAGQIAAQAGIAVGLPALIARKHGEMSGQVNPNTKGIIGTAAYGTLLANPFAALAYYQGHKAGRARANNP